MAYTKDERAYYNERKITGYLPPKLSKFASNLAQEKGMSKSEVVEMAVSILYNSMTECEIKKIMDK